MARCLSARVAKQAKLEKPSRGSQNRAAFLVVRGDVTKAIDDGWTIKMIWKTLYAEGKVGFGYEAFRRYVIRLVVGQRAKGGENNVVVKISSEKQKGRVAPAKAGVAHADNKTTATGIQDFTFDPVPHKEELV